MAIFTVFVLKFDLFRGGIILRKSRWQNFLKGYLTVRLEGDSPERFLNLCSFHGISIWNLECRQGVYQCCMYAKDFKSLRMIIRKTGKKVRIISRTGVPFFLHRNRKRKAAVVGIVLFFFILYVLSLFVWNIGFEGNQKYTDQVLLDFIQSKGYHHGMTLKSVRCEALEKEIRNTYSDITWVSVRLDGTRLIVKVKENENSQSQEEEPAQEEKTGKDLVAANSGIVRYIATRQGTPKVHVGDTVEKGAVLVSGTLEIFDDYGTLLTTHPVAADADIVIEYEEEYKEELSRIYMEKNYEETQTRPFLQIGTAKLPMIPFWNQKNLETEQIREVRQFHLFENFYLPIYYGSIVQKGYTSSQCLYSEEYISARAEMHLMNYFEKLQKLGVEIIENNVRIVVQEKTCLAQGTLLLWDKRIETISPEITEEIEELDERN